MPPFSWHTDKLVIFFLIKVLKIIKQEKQVIIFIII